MIVPKSILQNTVFRNFSVLTVGQVISRLINMFSCAILARWLSPEGYGNYSLIITYIALFGVIASLGMEYIINRYVARNQHDSRKFLHICLLLRGIGIILAFFALLVFNSFRDATLSTGMILCIIAGVVLNSFWAGLQSISFGMQEMKWNSILEVLYSCLTLLSFIIVRLVNPAQFSVFLVILIYLILTLLKDIAYYFELESSGILTGQYNIWSLSRNDIVCVMKAGFPFYLLALIGLATNQFPILFLDSHSSIEEVAYFNSANKLLLPITILLGTALTALFPNQSQVFQYNQDKFWKQISTMFNLLLISGSIIAFVISLFRAEIVGIVFGNQYSQTGKVMAYQCWYLVLFALFSLNGNALGASDRQKLLSIESILYALITTPIIFYSSYYGADGLAVGYLVSSIVNSFVLFSVLIIVSEKRLSIKAMLSSLFLFVSLLAISMLVKEDSSVLFKLIVFFVCMTFCCLLSKKEFAIIWKK